MAKQFSQLRVFVIDCYRVGERSMDDWLNDR